MSSRHARTGLALVLVGVLAACSGSDRDVDNASGGFPSQGAGEIFAGSRSPTEGSVRLASNGCWYLSVDATELMIVFPAGTGVDPELGPTFVKTSLGGVIGDGSKIQGPAARVAISDLPGVPDGYWGFITGFCDNGEDDAIVFDDLVVVPGG